MGADEGGGEPVSAEPPRAVAEHRALPAWAPRALLPAWRGSDGPGRS